MKVIAFFMIVCLIFLTGSPGKAKASRTSTTKTCCHGIEKKSHSSREQKDDCGQGMCNIMLSCPGCGFLTVDPIMVKPLNPISKEFQATPYAMGDLSGYSLINWNPPKV